MFEQNPSILIFFFPIFLSARLFYEPRSRYITNQSGSAKETVSQKIDENIKMLVCFICTRTQERTLIDHHYQITMNQHKY